MLLKCKRLDYSIVVCFERMLDRIYIVSILELPESVKFSLEDISACVISALLNIN